MDILAMKDFGQQTFINIHYALQAELSTFTNEY